MADAPTSGDYARLAQAIEALTLKLDAIAHQITSAPAVSSNGDERRDHDEGAGAGEGEGQGEGQGKRVRKPRARSKYNEFMSNELERLKKEYPGEGHRTRFAMAVQAWKSRPATPPAAEAGAGSGAEGD